MGKSIATKTSTRKLRKDWNQFILVGNNPLTSKSFEVKRFESFENLTKELPELLINSSIAGEWNYILYQVPSNFKLVFKYGYECYPTPHKHILTYSYHHLTPESIEVSNMGINLRMDPEETDNWERNLKIKFTG